MSSSQSQWLTDVESELPPPVALERDLSVDVAIIGGGFVGLWTAITLQELEPGLRIAVLERNRCGSGASGLNGGFVMSWWPKIASLARVCGRDDALWLADETTNAVRALGPYLAARGIDAEYRQSGWLWTATTPAHVGAWNAVVETAARLGREQIFSAIPAAEIARRTGSSVHLAGICEPINATVHPAKLARGLARIAAGLGVDLYENTAVERLERSRPARIVTHKGTVTADRVVIATNAWAASLPELKRKFVCVGSSIVATPEIPERLAAIGWSGNGVNPSRIGGRILAGLVLDRRERWTQNGLIDRTARRFPPEPLRYLGGALVRAAMFRKDRCELVGQHPSWLDKKLASLAPAGLEDKQ